MSKRELPQGFTPETVEPPVAQEFNLVLMAIAGVALLLLVWGLGVF